jgi:hypothetical protein
MPACSCATDSSVATLLKMKGQLIVDTFICDDMCDVVVYYHLEGKETTYIGVCVRTGSAEYQRQGFAWEVTAQEYATLKEASLVHKDVPSEETKVEAGSPSTSYVPAAAGGTD